MKIHQELCSALWLWPVSLLSVATTCWFVCSQEALSYGLPDDFLCPPVTLVRKRKKGCVLRPQSPHSNPHNSLFSLMERMMGEGVKRTLVSCCLHVRSHSLLVWNRTLRLMERDRTLTAGFIGLINYRKKKQLKSYEKNNSQDRGKSGKKKINNVNTADRLRSCLWLTAGSCWRLCEKFF